MDGMFNKLVTVFAYYRLIQTPFIAELIGIMQCDTENPSYLFDNILKENFLLYG